MGKWIRRLRCRLGWHSGHVMLGGFFCDYCDYATAPDYRNPDMQRALSATFGEPEVRKVGKNSYEYTWKANND